MALLSPQPITQDHEIADFDSGVASLDDWLKRRARANQASGATRTFVACDGKRVAGFYAIASGAIAVASAAGRFRRNMPDPVPVVVLGRLAVDRSRQGQDLGRDAALRTIGAAELIGIRGMIVHAILMEAKTFYLALGFEISPL